MTFNAPAYLLLVLPLFVGLYWLVPPPFRKWFLIAAGLLYYATWHPAYVLLPVGVAAVVWWSAARQTADAARPGLWVRRGLAILAAALIFFKYREFIAHNLGALGASAAAQWSGWTALPMPLGISFYVFAAAGMLVDVRQGRVKRPSFLDTCTLLTFWPCLTSGPILRFRELIPQFAAKKTPDPAVWAQALDRLVLGLVQKNLLANSLAPVVAEGFLPNAAVNNTSVDNWCLALAYGLQVYFDFAAYTNMAIGSALLLGLQIPENFRYPYHAKNPPDFWSRWHMSLSRWIRDYLFFPVNAKYKGAPAQLYISMAAIMALVGLWHGAGWGFVLWGAMHGAYLVIYRVWESATENKGAWVKSAPVRWSWRLLTLAAVIAAWTPFRAATAGQALSMMKTMLFDFTLRPTYGVNTYLITLLIAGYCLLEPLVERWMERWKKTALASARQQAVYSLVWRPVLYAVGIFLYSIFDDQDTGFIYFQF